MAVWSVPTYYNMDEDLASENQKQLLAEHVPLMKPVVCLINIEDDRVRDLAYNKHNFELGALHTGNFRATFRLWDIFHFRQVYNVQNLMLQKMTLSELNAPIIIYCKWI